MKNKNVENILQILSEELYQKTIGGVCWCYPLEEIKEYILELENKQEEIHNPQSIQDLQHGDTYYSLFYDNNINSLVLKENIWKNTKYEQYIRIKGNCFLTKEEGKKHLIEDSLDMIINDIEYNLKNILKEPIKPSLRTDKGF